MTVHEREAGAGGQVSPPPAMRSNLLTSVYCIQPCAQAMVQPVADITFHPFNKAHAAEWRAVRARFARDADDIQLATRDLVDTCFSKLRSVDAAAQLLHSFQRIQVGMAWSGAGRAPAEEMVARGLSG